MTARRGYTPKTDLTPLEKIKVAYFYEVRGIAQQLLADVFEVNQGRINEAIMEVRHAVGLGDVGDDD